MQLSVNCSEQRIDFVDADGKLGLSQTGEYNCVIYVALRTVDRVVVRFHFAEQCICGIELSLPERSVGSGAFLRRDLLEAYAVLHYGMLDVYLAPKSRLGAALRVSDRTAYKSIHKTVYAFAVIIQPDQFPRGVDTSGDGGAGGDVQAVFSVGGAAVYHISHTRLIEHAADDSVSEVNAAVVAAFTNLCHVAHGSGDTADVAEYVVSDVDICIGVRITDQRSVFDGAGNTAEAVLEIRRSALKQNGIACAGFDNAAVLISDYTAYVIAV